MKKTMISTAVLALLFASCSSDDGLTQSTLPLEGTPIQVNVAVADLQTRAGYDASNLPTEFYIDIINSNNSKYSYQDIKMKLEDGLWKSYVPVYKTQENKNDEATQMLWAGDNNKVQVTARTFKSDLTVDGYTAIDFETDQSNAEAVKKNDHLLMKTTPVTPDRSGIDVTFKHLMSKINLSIELRDEFHGTTTPTFSDVNIEGTFTSGGYAISNQEIESDPAVNPKTIKLLEISTPTEDQNNHTHVEYEAILMPQTVEANIFKVSFKVGERNFEWTSTESITLEGGKKYTLKLMAGHDKVSSASLSATNWESDSQEINGKTE